MKGSSLLPISAIAEASSAVMYESESSVIFRKTENPSLLRLITESPTTKRKNESWRLAGKSRTVVFSDN